MHHLLKASEVAASGQTGTLPERDPGSVSRSVRPGRLPGLTQAMAGRAGEVTSDRQEKRMQINCFVVREAENTWYSGMTGGTGQSTPLSDYAHSEVRNRTFIIHATSTSCIPSEF